MIKLENLSKYYVGNNEVALGLRKINLEFEVGELVAITGESGSGKSTLLNVLSGSDSYEEGEMYIEGKATSYFDEDDWESYRRDNIGFIYQSYNLIDSYTVYENVNVALAVGGKLGDNHEKIMEYLGKVGIAHLANKKATQLSSGQKQRLAIARALAKETKIIVADEPTGNLDSENSAEIMALINELATDKLVFVVTHNYDEIENYATRKIRIRDGEVEEDINLRPKKLSATEKSREKLKHQANSKEIQKKKKKMAFSIVRMNRANKPVTYAFLLGFLTVVAAAFYILLGSFFSNLDNTTSKVFDTQNFKNDDITRLIVRYSDNREISDSDVNKIANIKRVSYVDKYDAVGDKFYVYKKDEDYTLVYNNRTLASQEADYIQVKPTKKDKFMKTATSLKKEDLAYGELPKELYDVVVTATDDKLLGKELSIYIGDEKNWVGVNAELRCKVTGIINGENDQIYFSEKLGAVLSAGKDYSKYILEANALEDVDYDDSNLSLAITVIRAGNTESPKVIMANYDRDNIEEGYNSFLVDEEAGIWRTEMERLNTPVFIVNEDLTGNEIIVSENFVARTSIGSSTIFPQDFGSIIKMNIMDRTKYNQYKTAWAAYEKYISVPHTHHSEEYIENKKKTLLETADKLYGESEIAKIYMAIQPIYSKSTQEVIEVSEELYTKLVGGNNYTTQMSVYLEDYAYADDVLDELKEMGYEAASVYRAAAEKYDQALVTKKTTSMIVSIAGFFMVFFVGIFIIGTIMSIGDRDIKIMRLLGLERSTTDKINLYTILCYMAAGVILSLIIILVLNMLNVTYVVNIVKYYRWQHYLVYIISIVAFLILLNSRTKKRMIKINAK